MSKKKNGNAYSAVLEYVMAHPDSEITEIADNTFYTGVAVRKALEKAEKNGVLKRKYGITKKWHIGLIGVEFL